MKWQIKCFLKKHGFSNPFVWTYHPYILDAIKNLGLRNKLIYHCVDDLSAVPNIDKISYRLEEKRLLKKADIIFVTSKHLMKKCLQHNKNTYYFTNVVDFDHFSRATKKTETPKDLECIPTPRLGFVGALSNFKVDFELLNELALKRPQYQLILIGDEVEGQADKTIKIMKNYPNVHFLGFKKYQELPDYLRGIQVGLLPMLSNDYTKSMSPMKLNEYLASGLPVVSKKGDFISHLKKTNRVFIAKNNKNFISGADKQVNLKKLSAKENKIFINKNTWIFRTRKMLSLLTEARK